MRAIAAVGASLPLLAVSWHYVALVPILWLTWACAGWAAFQGMGAETSVELTNPVAYALANWARLSNIWVDLCGMAIEGLFCTVAISTVPEFVHGRWSLGDLGGLMFAPLYYVAQRIFVFPDLGKFARAGSEWGEVLVGALVGAIVTLEVLL
jgi:hypothetical protein